MSRLFLARLLCAALAGLAAVCGASAANIEVGKLSWVDLGAPPLRVEPKSGSDVYVFQGASAPPETSTATLLGTSPSAVAPAQAFGGSSHVFAIAPSSAIWPAQVSITPPEQSVSVSGTVGISGVATAANQTAIQSAPGTPQTTALTVQGNSSGIPLPVQAVDGATGSGSATSAAVFTNMPVDMTGTTALYCSFVTVGSGTVVFEGSNDGVNWAPVTAIRVDSSSGATAQTSVPAANTTFMLPGVAQQVRARVSVYTSGTFAISWVKKSMPPFAGIAALTAAYGVPVMTVKTTGGVAATIARVQSAASTNATSVKASTATLYSLAVANNGGSAAYLKLYNKASAPTVGTDTPVATILIPAGGSANVPLNDVGVSLSTGLAYAITGGAADNDTTAVGANQVTGFLTYS